MATPQTRTVPVGDEITTLRVMAQNIVDNAHRRCACDGEGQCGFHAELVPQFAEAMERILASLDYQDANSPTAAVAAAWRN